MAIHLLISYSGKKLVGNCPTHWSSTYLLVDRLISVKEMLNRVLQELAWDGIQASEWRMLKCIQKLLHPFAEVTSLVSGDQVMVNCNLLFL